MVGSPALLTLMLCICVEIGVSKCIIKIKELSNTTFMKSFSMSLLISPSWDLYGQQLDDDIEPNHGRGENNKQQIESIR